MKYHSSNLMSQIISTANLDAAMQIVHKQRLHDSQNSDIWTVSLQWSMLRGVLQKKLLADDFHLSPVQCYISANGYLTRWGAVDAIVIKAICLVLQPIIAETVGAYHLKGNGGLKGAVRQVQGACNHYHYVVRSDVHQFYQSMQKDKVLVQCKTLIKDQRILNIITQLIERVEIFDGEYNLLSQSGIPRGCALSPLIGALMLKSLGAGLPPGTLLTCYMDDWVILTNTRSQCRRAVKWMYRLMHHLGFKLAIAKTYIGKIANGFDFLGYRFNQLSISIAEQTIERYRAKLTELYERGATKDRILQYQRNWVRWVCAV